MILATSVLSLGLLCVAGVLLDAHRCDWRAAPSNDGQADGQTDEAIRFARRRSVRRLVATTTIAAVGVLVALWPLTPREPLWVAGYAATLVALAGLIFTLGVCDAWASSRYYRDESRRQLAEHVEELHRLHAERSLEAKRPDR